MEKLLNFENHISVTSADIIEKIIRPLKDSFNVRFFRYLKLYKNGKRIVLTNIPDAVRYMYGEGKYVYSWYDGEFPQFMKGGWYSWYLNRLLTNSLLENHIENDLTLMLGVYHGLTFVQENPTSIEFFSFDTTGDNIYHADKLLLMRFIYYFREQAKKLLDAAEHSPMIYFPIKNKADTVPSTKTVTNFLNETKINRYYLGEKHGNVYLTKKEINCIRWMAAGKTTEEIGMIENISIRTAQRHIENIKTKLNCQKQTQVLQLFFDLDILKSVIYK